MGGGGVSEGGGQSFFLFVDGFDIFSGHSNLAWVSKAHPRSSSCKVQSSSLNHILRKSHH